MSFFLIIFYILYGLMHLYAFVRAKAAFAFGISLAIPLAIFMVLMALGPVIIHQSEKIGYEAFARAAAYAGYIWMGVLFLFCSAAAALDIYRLLVQGAGYIAGKDVTPFVLSARNAFVVPLILALCISVYGYFEALNIRAERLVIKTPKISKEIGKLTIAQISDVHIGLIVREERLMRILDIVRAAKPDFFVSTGDLVDGQISRLNGLSDMLRNVSARYGKYAITGNHEYYAGVDQAMEFTRNAGFTILRGDAVTGPINIAGVDDIAALPFGLYRGVPEDILLGSLPKDKFTLLLKHRPMVDKKSEGLFDLQLSGHVHKGQIFPFSLITKYYYPVYTGYAEYAGHSRLYVSPGTGTWGPPIRFLAPPEVTIIELVHGE